MASTRGTTKSKAKAREATPLVDPRRGDIEDDASSTKARSMLSLAGSLLVEISLPKLILAWAILLVLPGLLLGLVPIVFAEWLKIVTDKLTSLVLGLWSILVLTGLIALAWFGWRELFRVIEKSFWALNSIVVEPGYASFREAFRQLAEQLFARDAGDAQRGRLRAASAAIAGLLVFAFAALLVWLAWPHTHLFGSLAEIDSWKRVVFAALANSAVAIAAYFGVAALAWGFADALMPQPRTLTRFDKADAKHRKWRVAHLSDVHVVGDRYGRRVESGRSGPSGNDRLKRLLEELDAIHAKDPLDTVLITGDMTDAGISSEWAEFIDALTGHPALAERTLMLPGNHDLNIVDRANPARLDLPTSPNRRLRQLRTLSAMEAVHGTRVRVVDREAGALGGTLSKFLAPHRADIARFADRAQPRFSNAIPELWAEAFPMVVPPQGAKGLGIILLNSNADTHFSFTNALGMVSAEQMLAFDIACAAYPDAAWIVALHHHLMEYPWAAKKLSMRVGTALINGNWFVRRMMPLASRAILMHGHRHIDWIGHCGDLRIVSAPSPVMEATDDMDTAFYIHTLAVDDGGTLHLLDPDRIAVPGEKRAKKRS
ncbi:MAG: metallophosphoesterase [Methyloceanibacter sp.]